MHAPKELLDVHPLGKSPVITDQGTTVAESGAIIGAFSQPRLRRVRLTWCLPEYLISKYGADRIQVPASGKMDDLFCKFYAELNSIVV
jgi:glutathione S-transferase